MIIFSGPETRVKYLEEITKYLKKNQNIFFALFLILPLIVFLSFKLNIGSSKANEGVFSQSEIFVPGNFLASVALVETGNGTGTAFLVGRSNLITARHVVSSLKEGDFVKLFFYKAKPQKEVRAQIVYIPTDEDKDYAVLKSEVDLASFSPLQIGNSDLISISDQIRVIGYPGGATFSSAPGEITNEDFPNNPNLVQLYAGAWPGNSGGPIVKRSTKEVIGILIAGYEDEFKGITLGYKINPIVTDPELKRKVGDLSQ